MVSEGAQTRRLPPTSPSLACLAGAGGGRGTGAATTVICFGRRSGGGWTGWTAAAAGSRRGCWRCPRCPTTLLSRVLSCLLCLTGVTQTPGMDRSGPAFSALRRAGWPGGSCIGGATAEATERLCYRQQDVCVRACVSVSMWSQKVRRLDDSLLPRRLLPAWLGGRRKRDRHSYYGHLLRPPVWWRLDRMDGSCCWLSPGMLAMPKMPYHVAVSAQSDKSNTNTRHG